MHAYFWKSAPFLSEESYHFQISLIALSEYPLSFSKVLKAAGILDLPPILLETPVIFFFVFRSPICFPLKMLSRIVINQFLREPTHIKKRNMLGARHILKGNREYFCCKSVNFQPVRALVQLTDFL